jgi:enolase
MTDIVRVVGRQIFDSRGNPSVEADVILSDGSSGASGARNVPV